MTDVTAVEIREDIRFAKSSNKLGSLTPFIQGLDARRLALVFAIVYFAQGLSHLPDLSITFFLKDELDFSAAQTAALFSLMGLPWLIKPIYGLISDFIPIFGRRRKSYFVLTSGLAAASGLILGLTGSYSVESFAIFVTLMGLGFAFNDVLVDAMMVENGHRLGLTGSFQSVQWAFISLASVLVGIGGGWLAEHHHLSVAFLIAAMFPLIALAMATFMIPEPRKTAGGQQIRETWTAIRKAIGSRMLWIVAAFIFFFNFSPSFGTALTYYATDELQFSKTFLGVLDSVGAAAGIVGAILYFAFCRSIPFGRLIHFTIAAGVISTLAYLGYQSATSALLLSLVFGAVGMVISLTILELAARGCPKHAEGTFFALLMAVWNGGGQLSQVTGGWLYDQIGLSQLIVVSACFTALCWFLVPFLNLERSNTALLGHNSGCVAA